MTHLLQQSFKIETTVNGYPGVENTLILRKLGFEDGPSESMTYILQVGISTLLSAKESKNFITVLSFQSLLFPF